MGVGRYGQGGLRKGRYPMASHTYWHHPLALLKVPFAGRAALRRDPLFM